MIDIYTEKKESKDWIIQNDLYFNLATFLQLLHFLCMDWVPFVIYLLDVRRCSIL